MVKWRSGAYGRSAKKHIGKYEVFLRDNPQLGYYFIIRVPGEGELFRGRGAKFIDAYDTLKTTSQIEYFLKTGFE